MTQVREIQLKWCECGCGQITRPERRFIWGHSSYLYRAKWTASARRPETVAKAAESLRKHPDYVVTFQNIRVIAEIKPYNLAINEKCILTIALKLQSLRNFCLSRDIVPCVFWDKDVHANIEPISLNALIQKGNKNLELFLVSEQVQRLGIENKQINNIPLASNNQSTLVEDIVHA